MEKVRKAISLNQKWYILLCCGIVLNFYLSYQLNKTNRTQTDRISSLEAENLKLKQTNTELLSASFSGQRILDELPFAFWRKKKVGNDYVMKFINEAGKKQFLESKGINRYYYHNRTDFDVFSYEDALVFHKEDSIVAHAVSDTIAHFDSDFHDAKGNKLIKDGYTRWKKVIDGDTMILGQMDKFYKAH